MPPKESYQYIKEAIDGIIEDRLYQMYLVYLPDMNKKNYISFNDFCDRATGANIDYRSEEEIIAEVEELKRRLQDGG